MTALHGLGQGDGYLDFPRAGKTMRRRQNRKFVGLCYRNAALPRHPNQLCRDMVQGVERDFPRMLA